MARDSGATVRVQGWTISAMRLRSWYGSIEQPARWALCGAAVCGSLGAAYGIAEAIHDYPVSSWAAVTLYVAMLAGAAGSVLGLLLGLLDRRPPQRQGARRDARNTHVEGAIQCGYEPQIGGETLQGSGPSLGWRCDSRGRSAVKTMYDRQHVDAVLKRFGIPQDQRNAILDGIHFPLDLDALQAVLAAHGITHDGLISGLGGSP
jgi:hypothetical protein